MKNQCCRWLLVMGLLMDMLSLSGQDARAIVPGPDLIHQQEVWLIGGQGDTAVSVMRYLEAQVYEEPELQFWRLMYLGNLWLSAGYVQEGGAYVMEAAKIAEEAELLEAHAQFQLHNLLGYVYTEQRDMELSLRSNEISLRVGLDSLGATSRQAANAYNNYGNALEVVREFSRALGYHHQARMIWQQLDSTQLYIRHAKRTNWLNLGAAHRGLMNLDSAEFYMRKALRETQSEPSTSFDIRIRAYNNLSVIYLRTGKFKEAEAYVKQAIQEADSAEHWIQSGLFHHNLADIYEAQAKWEAAIAINQQALDIKLRALKPDHLSLFETKYNIAKLYYDWGHLDSAEHYYHKVLERVGRAKAEELLLRGLTLSGLGTLNTRLGNLKQAEKYLSEAIQLEEQFADGVGDLARKYANMGTCLAKQGRYQEAESFFHKSIQALVPDWTRQSALAELDASRVEDPLELIKTLEDFAVAQTRTYQAEASSLDDLQRGLAALQELDHILDDLRVQLGQPENQREILAQFRSVYQNAQQLALQLFEQTQDTRYLDVLFQFREKLAASTLRAAVRASRIRKAAYVPDSLLTRERQLVNDILTAEQAAASPESARKLADLRQQQMQLWEQLAADYPAYYRLTQDFSVSALADLQTHLRSPGKVLLQISSLETEFVALALHHQKSHVIRIPKDLQAMDDLRFLIAAMHTDRVEAQAYAEAAHRWYERLIAPIQEQFSIGSLVVIPDDSLHLLPLEALISQLPEANIQNFEELGANYLLHQFPISYAYSATLWAEEEQLGREDSPHSFWALSPETSSHLGREVEELRKGFDIHQLQGGAATEVALMDGSQQIGILHIASHGRFTTPDPMSSYLKLSPGQGHDGRLHAWEIYQLELPAQLVVLAACETGKGEVFPGEGVMSLARAFTYAGCPSMISSLWEAESQTVSPIMVAFYQQLKQGQKKDRALQQAKIAYLNAPESRYRKAPYFWSNYILIGQNASVQFEESAIRWPWLVLILLFTGGGVFLVWGRNESNK